MKPPFTITPFILKEVSRIERLIGQLEEGLLTKTGKWANTVYWYR